MKHTWSTHEAHVFNIGHTWTMCALSWLQVCSKVALSVLHVCFMYASSCKRGISQLETALLLWFNNNNNNTSTEHLTRQVQQQSWQPRAKRTNMLISAPVISSSRLPLRPREFSTHQLASSWLILEEESQLILARLERPVIYFRRFLFWCSASMLFCCTTVCRPLTARTDDRTHLCIS